MKTNGNFGLAAMALSASLGMASEAQAHARLVSETPGANTTGGSTKELTLHFSEAVTPQFTGADLFGQTGQIKVISQAAKDGKGVLLSIPTALAPGHYTVKWRAVAADDGHHTSGDYQFSIK